MVQRLSEDVAERLRGEPFTYPEVGGTPRPQSGYRNFSASRVLTRTDFGAAVDDLMTWRVHESAGLRVSASASRAARDELVTMALGAGPIAVRVPCRVVYVVEEPDRAGFAYGTLPGHPECGEELFVVERRLDGTLVFTITAFSRPASRLARWGGPFTTLTQRRMTSRYLRSIDR